MIISDHHPSRRKTLKRLTATIAGVALAPLRKIAAQNPRNTSITDFGAISDGKTLNTEKIQSAIDHLATEQGGTLIIPAGEFLTGAIFLKPGVHLHLEKGAILKGSTNQAHYPTRKTRIEGHFEDWLPALINADRCHHLRITGEEIGRASCRERV